MIAVRKFRTLVVASLVTVVPVFVSAQATIDSYSNVTDARLINPEERNWLSYRGNLEGWGFSTLDEITTDNIANLEPVWTFSTGVLGGHELSLIHI